MVLAGSGYTVSLHVRFRLIFLRTSDNEVDERVDAGSKCDPGLRRGTAGSTFAGTPDDISPLRQWTWWYSIVGSTVGEKKLPTQLCKLVYSVT